MAPFGRPPLEAEYAIGSQNNIIKILVGEPYEILFMIIILP